MPASFPGEQVTVYAITGVAPDILVRIGLLDPPQKLRDLALVLRLERLSPQAGKSLDIVMIHGVYNKSFLFLRVGLAVTEVPGVRLKATGTAIATAGDKETDPHARAVGDVPILDISVVHMNSFSDPVRNGRILLPLSSYIIRAKD